MLMVAGRPKEYDRDDLLDKLITWSKLPQSKSLLDFCHLNDLDPDKLSCFARENPKFLSAYRMVKARIGNNRENLLSSGTLHQQAFNKNAHVYDYFMREEERDLMKYQSDLKRAENKELDNTAKECLDHIMNKKPAIVE